MLSKIAIVFALSTCLLLFFVGCNDRLSKQEKLAHAAMQNTLKILEDRYQMKFSGWSEGGDEQFYKSMGLNFRIFHVVSKDEGRRMLIEGIEELLKEINSSAELQVFLDPSPFLPRNVKLSIFDYHPNGKDVFYPDIAVFSFYKGKLHYKTNIPELPYTFYSEEEETYEEALNIVRTQEAAKM